MSVTIANTTANVTGKTVLLGERDHTITGAYSFNRSPSAPFIVQAGSANVANLDADKLDGQEGTYYSSLVNALNWATASLISTAYVPVFGGTTLGNGVVAGAYFQIGKLILWNAIFTLGTTSTVNVGPVTVTLPITASSTTSPLSGGGIAIDSSAGPANYAVNFVNNGTTQVLCASNASPMVGLTTAVPFGVAWASTDVLAVGGFYIAA